ncbi:SAM-dependent methyltransferase [Streptomyces sp. NPDC014894]|uniref:SAM-dependent methyltransferase n=1 Tax=unclassified Streptomyces TaxID=2593676 RepID=UPI0036FA3041
MSAPPGLLKRWAAADPAGACAAPPRTARPGDREMPPGNAAAEFTVLSGEKQLDGFGAARDPAERTRDFRARPAARELTAPGRTARAAVTGPRPGAARVPTEREDAITMSQNGPPLPTGVSLTALLVAGARVAENARLDLLYRDHLAQLLLESAGPYRSWWPFPRRDDDAVWQWLSAYIPLSTRFFDDCLLDSEREGVSQVVVLGAGLDTRAFRLPWSPAGRDAGDTVRTAVYEVDLPDVFAFKEPVLTGHTRGPRCDRVTVRADLRDDWTAALTSAGFRPDRPTVWLAEGLTGHLTPEQNDCLMARVTRLSAPGSRFAAEFWNSAALDGWSRAMAGAPSMDFLRDFLRPGRRGEPEEWFSAHGWRAEVHAVTELAHAQLRPRVLATSPGIAAAAHAVDRTLVVASLRGTGRPVGHTPRERP